MQRGKKQSPFIGRRVPLVDEGVPILYKRYTSVAEIVIDGPGSKKRAAPENGHAEPKEQQQSVEQQQQQQDQQQAAPAKKSKKEKKQQQQQQHQQPQQQQPEPELQQLAAAAIDPEAAALAERRALKAAKKEEKKKRKAAEREQAAAAAAADGSAGADRQHAPEGQAAEAAAEQEDKGNAEEAAKLRSVLGFTAAAAAAAPAAAAKAPPPSSSQFAFGFSNLSSLPPAERVAAETEAKLAAITAAASADKDGFVPRRVFVGGMPYSYSREAVAEYWSWCGTIESLDMLTFPDSGRFRGIAFITFETQEGADAALACNGEQLDGQTLKVDRCKAAAAAKQMKSGLNSSSRGASQQQQQQQQHQQEPQQQPLAPQPADGASGSAGGGPGKTPGYNVAYVGNIAFEAGPADISALFADCGVTKVRLHTDKASGKSKGYAHVHFGDASGLDKAIGMSGSELHGRCIKVSYGQPKKA